MTEPTRKRKRAVISCTLCRRRKIRCNRETPCSNCIRSQNETCVYEDEPPRDMPASRPTPLQSRPDYSTVDASTVSRPLQPRHEGSTTFSDGSITNILSERPRPDYAAAAQAPWNRPALLPITPESSTSMELDSMRSKVAELERQLQSRNATPSVATPALTTSFHVTSGLAGPIDVLHDGRTFGQAHPISRGISHKNRVFGQSHWMNGFVVLRDVVELLEPQMRSGTSTLPADIHRAKMLARVIKKTRSPEWPALPTLDLPPKEVCDELVGHYLGTIETLYRILHIPAFTREYESLWSRGSQPQSSFMIQVKLVLAIGAIFHDENCSMRPDATRWIYEAQTWLSSPTFKSKLGIQHLQTSILLLLAREFADVGSELVWISAGALLREAVYVGLHKDPSGLPRMNGLETEMRRRIWNTILELNLQFSLISGGPCLISLEDFNTEPPRNFDDDQLTETEPLTQPHHILTQTSCAIALRKTLPMRLTVVKFLNDIATSGTFEETLRIDTALRASYKILRQALQGLDAVRSHPFAVSAIDFIMHRYISSLHIPYFNPSLHEAIYAYSRKTVFDTSLKLWNLAYSNSAINESDLARLCRCGAGFFRAFTFHASAFLTVELSAQLQEEDSVPRPDLLTIPEDAADLYLRCIAAGETGIKGYLLLKILIAQIDGVKRGVRDTAMQQMLGRAAEEAIKTCLPVLERMAGHDSEIDGGAAEFDFSMPDFIGNWDLAMSDVFNFDGGGNLEAFMM